jgi:transposase
MKLDVIIGLDPHKRSNTIAVMTNTEELLDRQRFDNSDEGIAEMLAAVQKHSNRVWAVEGPNGIGNSIAQRLVKAGEIVFDVPAKLATRVRVYSTGHGTKTDDTDAVAIGRAAIHSRHLRQVRPDGASVAIRLLSDRRQELVAARTQSVTRLHRLLRELISGGAKRQLSAEQALILVNGLNPDDPATLMRVEIAREHIADIERLDLTIDECSLRLIEDVKASETTLTRLFGIGPLNAALILGDVGDVSRFPTRNHFASYTGTAPIAVSSGDRDRHRLSRSGNRRLNRVTHIAAITQIRFDTPGRVYYRRKLAEGKSTREALRCLKRRISDAIYQQLRVDQKLDQTQDQNWPRWPSQRGVLPHYKSPATLRANGKPKQVPADAV